VEVELPPLRERREDILLIAQDLLRKFSQRHQRPTLRFSPGVLATLQEHGWPGNIRELQNVIERAVVVCDGPEIGIADLPQEFGQFAVADLPASLDDAVREFKRCWIQRTLAQTGQNKVAAARILGIARSSLHRLIEELHILEVAGHRGANGPVGGPEGPQTNASEAASKVESDAEPVEDNARATTRGPRAA
jgi:two-component system NtrC family response regulator